jgi:hypothetical protein
MSIYPTREAYARKVWASLDSATRADHIAAWHDVVEFGPVVPFYGWLADNMDARHNGTVTFTAVEGGYLVDDEAGTPVNNAPKAVGQLRRCTEGHGATGNAATVYGHFGSNRTCIRLHGTRIWVYDPGWEGKRA